MKLFQNSPVCFTFSLDKQLFSCEEKKKKKRLTQFCSSETHLSDKLDLHLDTTRRGQNNLRFLRILWKNIVFMDSSSLPWNTILYIKVKNISSFQNLERCWRNEDGVGFCSEHK